MGDGVGEMDAGTEGGGVADGARDGSRVYRAWWMGGMAGRTEGCMEGWVWDCGTGRSGNWPKGKNGPPTARWQFAISPFGEMVNCHFAVGTYFGHF